MTKVSSKNNYLFLVALVITVVCFGCIGIVFNTTVAYADPGETTIKIAHLSDTHIFIEEYCNRDSTRYTRAFNSDAKLMEESTAAIQASLDAIFEEKVDYLIVSGDLTSNAEYYGHVKMAEMLADLTTRMRAVEGHENFQVFVTTGNHDLYNSGASSFMPTQAELDACPTEAAKLELLTNYKSAVRNTSLQDFANLYFTTPSSESYNYFYESDYWYDDAANPLETKVPSQAVIDEFEEGTDAYELLAPYARTGGLSYIARTEALTIVMFDTSLRTYEGAGALDGWEHKTGGMVTDNMLKWAIEGTAIDRLQGRPVIVVTHQNILPHFEVEDEILKDFTLFNWEKVAYTLADAGIRYGFSGHMHSFDIASYITQNGNVFYDFETGSPISYASGGRILELTTAWNGTVYTENIYSTVINNDVPLSYSIPKYNSLTGLIEQEEYTINNLLDYLDEHQTDMIPRLLDGYLDEAFIMGTLKGMLEGIRGTMGLGDTLYNLAIKFVDDLATLNLDKPVFSNGYDAGSTYTFDGVADANYHLFELLKDLVNWFVLQDITFGLSDAPYTLSDAAADIYKAHISGIDTATLNPNLQNLVTKCNSGELVDFLITTLTDFLFPQLEIITNATIRANINDPALAAGTGFDIATEIVALKTKLLGIIIANLMSEENIMGLLSSLTTQATTLLSNVLVTNALNSLGLMDTIDKYLGTVLGYLTKLDNTGSITAFVENEVMSKYVTDALKVNLGRYVGLIITGWAIDDTDDGTYADPDSERAWNVVHEQNFHVKYSADVYGGNTYRIDTAVEGSGSLAVTSTIANGLLPSMLSVNFGTDVTTEKEFKWYTKIQTDIYNPNTVPASYIKYWTGSDIANATMVTAESTNVARDIPLIDLGITYLTKAIHTFNMHTVSLSGLLASSTYYYQVGSDAYGWTDTYSFTTGAADGSFTILAITDIQGSVEQNYIDSYAALQIALNTVVDPAFIISAGDNVDKGSSTYQWKWLLDGQRDIWANNTFVTVAGNHEETDSSIEKFLALPSNSINRDSGHYYSYNYSNTHFVILNTNDLASDNALSATQTQWLITDLAEDKANPDTKWTIVVLHKGLYTAGSHAFDNDVIALRAQLSSIFVEGGVDLVLQGHDHTYSVSKYIGADSKPVSVTYDDRGAAITPDGIPYINLGTIGDKFYNYIYSEEVYLMDRKVKDYKNSPLAKYFVNGKLEISESPVFMKLTVDENNISMTTYAIIDGVAVVIDNIIISDAPVYNKLSAGAIAGIAVGSAVGAGGIGFAIFWFAVRKKKIVA
ncbi:MAG: hypothetical protein EOM87_00135 [Clostridia bacterium]|nr:hypothetical protein [Clostridia bacterium]